MTEWWFSCSRLTVFVGVNDRSIITETAPVTKRFTGQSLANLEEWFRQLGGFRKEKLKK